ncbi:hypothetical protein [Burkholderia alba]|uniref:hypothetical protein n=1 Tax=Burkholderia alba TaxID=2683677 RepID=UPI002B05A933|nr:hypothetical protein [Burkholderia alba]
MSIAAALFFAGLLLCNCIPHLVRGLCGLPFPTPFATPRGVGDSSARTNLLWGFVNLVAGLAILSRYPVTLRFDMPLTALLAGGLVAGLYLSTHFGKVMRDRGDRAA